MSRIRALDHVSLFIVADETPRNGVRPAVSLLYLLPVDFPFCPGYLEFCDHRMSYRLQGREPMEETTGILAAMARLQRTLDPGLVARVACLLACSRVRLRLDEFVEIAGEAGAEVPPEAVLEVLCGLEPLIRDDHGTLVVSRPEDVAALREFFTRSPPSARGVCHRAHAAHFERRLRTAIVRESRQRRSYVLNKLSHHLLHGGETDRLYGLLTSFAVLNTMTGSGKLDSLLSHIEALRLVVEDSRCDNHARCRSHWTVQIGDMRI